MHDPEIKRVAGKSSYDCMTLEQQVRHNLAFNDQIQKLQQRLPGGFPGIRMGVYRFKTPQEADAQIEQAILRGALLRQNTPS